MDAHLPELIGRYQTIAIRYLEGRLRDADSALDLYQGVVQAILERQRVFSSADHLRNYFFVCLRNAAVDHERGRRRSREVRLPEDVSALDRGGSTGPSTSQPDVLIAEEEADRARRRIAELESALGGLDEAERALLRERFWERKTFREIKERTGVPISTLKSREDALLRKLKKTIGKTNVET